MGRQMNYRFIFAFVVAGILSGCGFLPNIPISPDQPPPKDKGFIYGRFYNDVYGNNDLSREKFENIGVRLSGPDSLLFSLKDRFRAVYAVAATPGVYHLQDIVFGDVDRNKPFENLVASKTFVVEPGKAYYIGDFFGTGSSTRTGNVIHTEWKITDINSDFRKTSEELNEGFPSIRSVEKVYALPGVMDEVSLSHESGLLEGNGAVFGVFGMEQKNLLPADSPRVALCLRSQDGKYQRLIPFGTNEVRVFELPVGDYMVEKVILGEGSEVEIRSSLRLPIINVRNGGLTYIGNHNYYIERRNHGFWGGYRGVVNNFSVDKDVVGALYKKLDNLPKTSIWN